jgi:gluconate 5-dehydrogenase
MGHPLFDLSGKTALVTGSTRGIGLALARGLARAGAQVVLNSRQPAAVDDAVASTSARSRARLHAPRSRPTRWPRAASSC